MAEKKKAKPKLTYAERHKRFVEMAREVKASESARSFDIAFSRIAKRTTVMPPKPPKG